MAAFFDAAGARAGAGAAAGHDTHQANPLCRSSIPTSDSTSSSSSSRRHPPCILAAIMLLLLALPACCRGSGLARPAFLRPHLVSASSCLAVARGVHPQQQQQQQRPGPAPCIAARVFSSSPAGAVEGGGGGGAEGIAAAVERDLSPSPASVVSAPALKLKRRQRRTVTGGLKNLPIALPAVELLNRALRVAKYMKIDEEKVKNPRQRARKLGVLRLDSLTKGISRPLKEVVKAYEYELSVLHPFEATLADLTVRARAKRGRSTLPEVLGAVNELRKEVLEVGKTYVGLAKNASTKAEAVQAAEDGIKAIEGLVLGEAEVILELIEVQKALRKIPIVQLGTPTVVLVGAPNVGKSSIVRAISSGTPEVNNYPFTTRGMTLGHIAYPDWDEQCQVMDTPGVLNRPDGERNEMEALTLASMQHLPTAVMFVLDLTGHSGALSSIQNQLQIRNDLRARFPKRPWVDVVSKADLPLDPSVQGQQGQEGAMLAPPGALRVSTADGTGLPALEGRVREMLTEVREVLALFRLRPQDDDAGAG